MKTEQIKKQNRFLSNLGWWIALIAIGIIIGILLSHQGLAYDWPFGKEIFCQFGNLTGVACDSNWCNQVINSTTNSCSYDTINNICSCTPVNTTSTNETNETQQIIASNYYNKTEIDNITITLRNNLLDRIDNQTYPTNNVLPQEESWPWYAWFLMIVAVCGTLIYLTVSSMNKKKFAEPKTVIRPPYRKPQPQQQKSTQNKPKTVQDYQKESLASIEDENEYNSEEY